jgi:hypothetical protein
MGQLPTARLHPRNAEDRAAILRSRAKEGARTAGRAVRGVAKVSAIVLASALGLAAIGSMRTTRPYPPRYQLKAFDSGKFAEAMRVFEQRRIEQNRVPAMYVPKLDLGAPALQHEPRATSSR